MKLKHINNTRSISRNTILFCCLTLVCQHTLAQDKKTADPKKLYPPKQKQANVSPKEKKEKLLEEYLNIVDSISNINLPKESPKPANSLEKIISNDVRVFADKKLVTELTELAASIQKRSREKREKMRNKVNFIDTKTTWQDDAYLNALLPTFLVEQEKTKNNAFIAEGKPKEIEAVSNATPLPENVASLIPYAMQYIGTPYRGGATGPSSFDCSGFTFNVFSTVGLKLPRSSAAQAGVGEEIAISNLQPGDLLFFKGRNSNSHSVGHVGIVSEIEPDGTVKMIHASTSRGVMIDKPFIADYYKRRFLSARRVLNR